jgi:hypothetical protein
MNFAKLGVYNKVTLGWVAGAHPSFSYRNEMKERIGKLMTVAHKDSHYALYPRAFHYITNKNKRLATRGITIQKIMKSDEISPTKIRGGMVHQWQMIEEASENPLRNQYFVPVGRGAELGTTAMTKIFHSQNDFLRTTRMKIVHNLGEMDELLDIELNEHATIAHEYRALCNIIQFQSQDQTGNSLGGKDEYGWHIPFPIPREHGEIYITYAGQHRWTHQRWTGMAATATTATSLWRR